LSPWLQTKPAYVPRRCSRCSIALGIEPLPIHRCGCRIAGDAQRGCVRFAAMRIMDGCLGNSEALAGSAQVPEMTPKRYFVPYDVDARGLLGVRERLLFDADARCWYANSLLLTQMHLLLVWQGC
jgi:hypothetical protein